MFSKKCSVAACCRYIHWKTGSEIVFLQKVSCTEAGSLGPHMLGEGRKPDWTEGEAGLWYYLIKASLARGDVLKLEGPAKLSQVGLKGLSLRALRPPVTGCRTTVRDVCPGTRAVLERTMG